MEDASDLEKRAEFHDFFSRRSDHTKKRQNDIVNKGRMKQPDEEPHLFEQIRLGNAQPPGDTIASQRQELDTAAA